MPGTPQPLPTPYDIVDWTPLPLEVPPWAWILVVVLALLALIWTVVVTMQRTKPVLSRTSYDLVRRELESLLRHDTHTGTPAQRIALAARLVREYLETSTNEKVASLTERELKELSAGRPGSTLYGVFEVLADAELRAYAPVCTEDTAHQVISDLLRRLQNVREGSNR